MTGANQAVAIAKSEKNVTLAGQIGKDGEWVKNLLESFNVSTDLLEINDDIPTGRATIQISNEGENSILLFGGTNQLIYNQKLALSNFTHLLLQEEIVHSQTCETLVNAKKHNVTTIYNPSPMPSVEDIIKFPWSSLDYIIVNAGEATDLFSALSDKPLPSKPSPLDLIDLLMNDTQLNALQGLIITLGEKGLVARIKNNENKYVTFDLPSTSVKAVDTTGAGDTFAGYFTSCLMSINDMSDQNIELSLKNSMGVSDYDYLQN